jgi:tRNA/tmRNA/rRNA uracil-C5-methylase (TrmA/RlmC/RlmD family)
LRAFAAQAGISAPEIVKGPRAGFRYRARLAIRGRAGAPKLGIFEENSHRVVHIPNCVVHHPLINQVAGAVLGELARQRTPPYSDEAHAGVARYLAVAVESASKTAQVVLVTHGEFHAELEPLFDGISQKLGDRLHSLWHNAQSEKKNAILGPTFRHLGGGAFIHETIGQARVFYAPGAFGQSNLELFAELVEQLHRLVPARARVLELYAGVGAIGLGLAARSEALVLNEIGEHSLAGLEQGIANLEPELRRRVRLAPGSAAAHAELIADADVVIADPPRKGLDPEVLDALIRHRPGRLLYVSCGLDSFLSQGKTLLDRAFALESLKVFDLFPFTEHVEVLACFAAR